MRDLLLGMRKLLPALALALATATAFAQGPTAAPQDTQAQRQQVQPGNNAPTWREVRSGKEGVTTVKGRETGVLIQSQGETWRMLRNGPITFYGGWLVVLALITIGVFYKVRGPIGLHGAPVGKLIERFSSFERMAHWSVAISFCILALSGLTMLFGKYVLLPLIGHTLFGWLATLGKDLHNLVGPLFMFSIIVFFFTFVRDNFPRAYDLIWLVKAGGVMSGEVVPAGRFNAGEKIWFWGGLVALGTISCASGLVLDFPNFDQTRALLMLANIVHVIAALFFIVWAFTHIYLGTVGTVGAYEGMRTGYVDETWAREHAQYWFEDVKSGRRPLPSGEAGAAATPTAPQTQH